MSARQRRRIAKVEVWKERADVFDLGVRVGGDGFEAASCDIAVVVGVLWDEAAKTMIANMSDLSDTIVSRYAPCLYSPSLPPFALPPS